jgi:hypothetical protein
VLEALLTALVAALLLAPPAAADYLQVPEHFGEGEQIRNALGIAVNATGAGGVEAGSFYVVGRNNRVLRFGPGKEGEAPPFREAWGWGVLNGVSEFQRCGPALATTCTNPTPNAGFGGEEAGHFSAPAGVAVDQMTGYVFVLNTPSTGHREKNLVEAFTANGAALITRFGEAAGSSGGESIAEMPGKLHELHSETVGIAVDDSGRTYLSDNDYSSVAGAEARVMCFKPEPAGDFEHYAYCGRPSDVKLGTVGASFVRLALDDAGHLYGTNEETIKEYDPASPAAPLCTFPVAGAAVKALATNSATGEVFYFKENDKKVHRLGPCNTGTGKFEEIQGAVEAVPATQEIRALAVNPTLIWGAERPSGVLYAADGGNHFEEVPPHHGIGDVLAAAAERAPVIEAESATATASTTTTLSARIDPRGFSTHFVFQYLTEAEYQENGESFDGVHEARKAPFPAGGQIGGGQVGTAAAAVSGLAPDTEYRFRVIATSQCAGVLAPACEEVGDAAAFKTYPPTAPGLSDDRAYELVSPTQKSGGEVFPADPTQASCGPECKPPGGINVGGRFPMQASPDGEGVVYEGYPFSVSQGSAVFNEYLSRRTAGGWQTTSLSPALQAKNNPQGHLGFSSTLGAAVVYQGGEPTLTASAPAGQPNLYTQPQTALPGEIIPVVTSLRYRGNGSAFAIEYAAASPDFSRYFFTANDSLTDATAFAPEPPDPSASGSDLYEFREGQLMLVSVLPGNAAIAPGAQIASKSPDNHAVSQGGSRVFFTSAGQLYVREGGQSTAPINHAASFRAASADGSLVLLSDGCLYALASESCTDLTESKGGFIGLAGQSEDLSHVYFVDTAKLPGAGENAAEEEAQPGQPNLYSWQPGSLAFVATLLPTDNTNEEAADWVANPAKRTAQASPAGRYLAFLSQAKLTGYENVGPACKLNSVQEYVTAPCFEAFLYDSATGRLICASCNPSGEPPLGRSTLRRISSAEEWLPQSHYLTDSGRLYFDSSDRLSPLDANGRVEDVYEVEPQGVGTCSRAAGCVSLISAGVGTLDSNLLAVDEDGANIFFTTRERLVPKDQDSLIDLYDAREFGGFPEEGEAAPGECAGEACLPTAPAPAGPIPATPGFDGPGNVCPKGKVKRKGKCVAKRYKSQNKKHKHKRSHGKVNRGGDK